MKTARIVLANGNLFEATWLERGPHSVTAEGRKVTPGVRGPKRYASLPIRVSWSWAEVESVTEPIGGLGK